jgi:RNA polymerase sigma-70 factor (ECF subfamily)
MDTPRSETKSKNTERTNVKEDFSVVFEKQFSVIYNYVYARILHHERTEDLVSEVFIKAMKHYDSYNPSIASVRTWLTNIARNTLIDEFRKSGRAQVYSLDAETEYIEPSGEDDYPIMKNPANNEVRAILLQLSDAERELIAMIYYEGLSNPEIGQILGINAKAVSERHRRLLAKCRKLEAGKNLHDYL